MACAQPFLYIPKSQTFIPKSLNDLYFPCGWCLNCRVDKRNALEHRAEYELMTRLSNAFVTFTYDDPHIVHLLRKTGRTASGFEATLSKREAKKFLDRLNKQIKKLPNCKLSQHDYKYIITGEYGGNGSQFDRPHFHCLFFGLDAKFCKKAFAKAWQGQGQIDVGYITKGGIRYVLKYLDKQVNGEVAKELYENHGLERPFSHHSVGFGSELYSKNVDYARNHNGCYRYKGKDVPYPTYWKNKYLVSTFKDNLRQVQNVYDATGFRPKTQYDLHDYKMRIAKNRFEHIKTQMIQDHTPFYDERYFIERKYGKPKYDLIPFSLDELVSNFAA